MIGKDSQNGKATNAQKETRTRRAGGSGKKRLLLCAVCVLALAAAAILGKSLVLPMVRYRAAVKLSEEGKYAEAVAAFEALDGYKDSAALARDAAFQAAARLYEAGSYDEAIAAFRALEPSPEREARLEACYIGKLGEENYRALLELRPGDSYTFGAYEQDNDPADGKEAIEWIVLEKEGSSLLLISKYGLDVRAFHTPYALISWESCSLRAWMNGSFLDEAFTAEERAWILESPVAADPNPQYEADPGNATTDRAYILSIAEAERWFPTEQARQCRGTAYCVARGAKTDEDGNSWWLLRTPGYETRLTAFINSYGGVSARGDGVNHERSAIRPVIRIDPLA